MIRCNLTMDKRDICIQGNPAEICVQLETIARSTIKAFSQHMEEKEAKEIVRKACDNGFLSESESIKKTIDEMRSEHSDMKKITDIADAFLDVLKSLSEVANETTEKTDES